MFNIRSRTMNDELLQRQLRNSNDNNNGMNDLNFDPAICENIEYGIELCEQYLFSTQVQTMLIFDILLMIIINYNNNNTWYYLGLTLSVELEYIIIYYFILRKKNYFIIDNKRNIQHAFSSNIPNTNISLFYNNSSIIYCIVFDI